MRELRIVGVLLDWARDELGFDLKSNPARALKVRGACDARFPYITPKQKKQLLLELAKSKSPNHKRLTQLALTTGMRRCELLAMKWTDLDLTKRLVHLNRKDCAAQGLPRSYRFVPLSPKAVALFKRYPQTNEHVIELSVGVARHGFDRARKAVGLNELRFHDLRHIAISSIWADGINALQISEASDHKDLRMLMRYSHYGLGYGG